MNDYDFKVLNDKEFEILCADLISHEKGVKFERFKPGKDQGIDGRYFSSSGEKIHLQCKHPVNTSFAQFLSHLKKEADKAIKLDSTQYLFVVSYPLSSYQKTQIANIFLGIIKNENDIYGKEDLNDILSKHPEIERRFYKLWISTGNTFINLLNNDINNKGDFSLEEILNDINLYVETENHTKALQRLEDKKVAIITGLPGIGKTTLANHLCLFYVKKGYKYEKINNITEGFKTYLPGQKQIFYFDDFLGSNYLQAINDQDGSQIMQFIRKISKEEDKRFVLTSRTSILNKGKELIEQFHISNVQNNEFEVTISSLTKKDRAFMLYNQIFYGGLEQSYIEEIYLDRRYRNIVTHKNFNPRLIRFITDPARLKDIPSSDYWNYIEYSLKNPAAIWEMPFRNQTDDYGKALIKLVVFNGQSIEEDHLSDAYSRYLQRHHSPSLIGTADFTSCLRVTVGALLNRTIQTNPDRILISPFNPSISDYILKNFCKNKALLIDIILSLRSFSCLRAVDSLHREKLIKSTDLREICILLFEELFETSHASVNVYFTAKLCSIYEKLIGTSQYACPAYIHSLKFVLTEEKNQINEDFFLAVERGLVRNILTSEEVTAFLLSHISSVSTDSEIRLFTSTLTLIKEEVLDKQTLIEKFEEHIMDLVNEDFGSFFETADAFAYTNPGDYDEAKDKLVDLMETTLRNMGITLSDPNAIETMLENYPYRSALDSYHEDHPEIEKTPTHWQANPPSSGYEDIDDVFDRN